MYSATYCAGMAVAFFSCREYGMAATSLVLATVCVLLRRKLD